jgi:wyosine [tRNA(Phe)-imidazoG37] synthetase (radical SAM superfamily)
VEPSQPIRSSDPRLRIKRAADGYVLLGRKVSVWEPTLDEARETREELEWPGWRYPLLPGIGGRQSRPPGAVVYGPVTSRRLGRSLGINLMRPGCSVRPFRCVYCEFPRKHCRDPYGDWPTPDGVGYALANALPHCGPLDSITISGCGEPTMHPDFDAVVGRILAESRRARRGVPVRILTNGATAVRPEIHHALNRLDERIVTLDAAPERVDLPDAYHPLGSIVYGISLLRDFTLQSCFIDGRVSNVDERSVREWADLVGELQPGDVQIFTTSRRPAEMDVRPVSGAQLEEIACVLRARTGIEARVFA